MKILLVNGSPRRSKANSRIVLDEMRKRLGEAHQYRMAETMAAPKATAADLDADLLIVAFPLYIDSLHSTLLRWLLSYEELRKAEAGRGLSRRVAMIGIANNGFHEGIQNKGALDILENFCERAGIEWRGGAGIGTGEMMTNVRDAPDSMFIKRPVSRVFDEMAVLVRGFEAGRGAAPVRIYAAHAFPWIVYKAMGHMGWRQQAKANGVSKGAILARPLDGAASLSRP